MVRRGVQEGDCTIRIGCDNCVANTAECCGEQFFFLSKGFARRNKVNLAQSLQRAAESELAHAREKTVRQVWKAYNDAKVSLAKERAASALLAASEKSWSATFESYQHGLATFPDVRESERNLTRARTLDQAARAEVLTRAAAFAFSTGDLARP